MNTKHKEKVPHCRTTLMPCPLKDSLSHLREDGRKGSTLLTARVSSSNPTKMVVGTQSLGNLWEIPLDNQKHMVELRKHCSRAGLPLRALGNLRLEERGGPFCGLMFPSPPPPSSVHTTQDHPLLPLGRMESLPRVVSRIKTIALK